jgi:RIO kinase 1
MPKARERDPPSDPSDGAAGAAGDAEQAPLLRLEDLEADGDDAMPILASNDEWAFRRADRLTEKSRDRRGDSDRKTEGEVFDKGTLLTLHKMLLHGVLRSLDFPVSTGKEANVFRGTTPRGGYVAVKIFRTNTSTFKHVLQYIQGDERFEGVTGDKRALVHAWTKKEFRNLVRAREVGVLVPDPIKSLNNVLIMEYLGVKKGPWPTLKAATVDDSNVEAICKQVVDDYVTLYNQADLIHADLSEYNVLLEGHGGPVEKQRARIIDIGQAVLKNHPMAQEFLERDLRNITTYFRRKGVRITPQDIMVRLKHERTMSKERNEERPDADDEELDSIVVKTKAKGKASDKPAPALRPAKPGRGKRKVREARERAAKEDNP